ncbi:DUF5684 domain-containing protein [Haloarcula brevis]|uniref:DUF5684 domain-containing protein n=1 Tax=Haloarcula brevis TaxID=3111453 RepID=UPI00300F61B8
MVPIELIAPLQSGGAGDIVYVLFQLLVVAVQIAGMWLVFRKAGHAGWKAIVPIYNFYVMLKIGGNAWWWLVLLLVPILNIYALYRIHAGVARAFGRGIGFGLGLAFLGVLFFPLLGFGDYEYRQSDGLA